MRSSVFYVCVLVFGGGLLALCAAAPPAHPTPPGPKPRRAVATFAGGCFWCMQPPFDKVDGVISTTVGYTGGHKKNPTYKEVSSGMTGHAEAIQIVYDPSKVSYAELLDIFWHNIDPSTPNRQFCDRGDQYRTAIYYHDAAQKALAEESRAQLERSKRFHRILVTEVTEASTFYPAEDYHQEFYKKNPKHYKAYRKGCGRDERLRELWGESGHMP